MSARGKDARPFVIVVEDEAFQREALVEYLEGNGFRAVGVEAGAALRKLVEKDPPVLVLLDLHLPGGEDGFALARWLRERSARVGIIMVTAGGDTIDRVVGLETGADDYIAKPFEPRELLARVQTVLRRAAPAAASAGAAAVQGVWRFEGLTIDLDRHEVRRGEATLELTGTEYELLVLLASQPGRVFSRDDILTRLRGHAADDIASRAVDILVSRLRRKLEPLDSIRTLRNAGYRFVGARL
jgi:DNA-binding response OmpR family regulator